jgi:hypothetical protein
VTVTCLVHMIRTFMPLRKRTSHSTSMRHWRRMQANQQYAENYSKFCEKARHEHKLAQLPPQTNLKLVGFQYYVVEVRPHAPNSRPNNLKSSHHAFVLMLQDMAMKHKASDLLRCGKGNLKVR